MSLSQGILRPLLTRRGRDAQAARLEGDNAYVWKRNREGKEADSPYLIRLRTLKKLRKQAARKVGPFGEFQAGQKEAWKIRASTAMNEILGESHPLVDEVD